MGVENTYLYPANREFVANPAINLNLISLFKARFREENGEE